MRPRWRVRPAAVGDDLLSVEVDAQADIATVTVRGIAGLGYPDATTPLDITVGPSPPAKTVEECRSYWQPILAGRWSVRDLYNYTYAPEPAT